MLHIINSHKIDAYLGRDLPNGRRRFIEDRSACFLRGRFALCTAVNAFDFMNVIGEGDHVYHHGYTRHRPMPIFRDTRVFRTHGRRPFQVSCITLPECLPIRNDVDDVRQVQGAFAYLIREIIGSARLPALDELDARLRADGRFAEFNDFAEFDDRIPISASFIKKPGTPFAGFQYGRVECLFPCKKSYENAGRRTRFRAPRG